MTHNLLYLKFHSGCKDDCDFITLGTYKSVDNYAGAQNVVSANNTLTLYCWKLKWCKGGIVILL